MRRIARYTFNALAVLSLLLCVATVTLSVRSYWRPQSFWHSSFSTTDFGYRVAELHVERGRWCAEWVAGDAHQRFWNSGFQHGPVPPFPRTTTPTTFLGFAHEESSKAVAFYRERRRQGAIHRQDADP